VVTLAGCQKERPEKESKPASTATPQESKAEEQPSPTEESKEEDIEIEIPGEQKLVADYTTVTGLKLEPGAHIAVVVMDPKSNYWSAVRDGMTKAVDDMNKALGYTGEDKIYFTYEGPDDLTAAEEQINIIDAVLAENPQALCIAAIDQNSCEAQLETAQENGIPVIILDSSVESEALAYTVCETDNDSAGRLAARKLCEKIGDQGTVLITAHLQNADTSAKREAGFRDEIAKNHPNVKVLETIYQDAEENLEKTLNQVFEKNPDVKGCFTTSEETGLKLLDYLDKYALDQVQLIGFDAGEKQMDAIREGKEYGVICQNPHGMGYATVVAAARAIQGLENDDYIDAGFQWIDGENLDAPENQKYLYE
jgi:ribose transport system substrate-binding protein